MHLYEGEYGLLVLTILGEGRGGEGRGGELTGQYIPVSVLFLCAGRNLCHGHHVGGDGLCESVHRVIRLEEGCVGVGGG